jgi:uncharacterized phage protein (TIGR01671 family)
MREIKFRAWDKANPIEKMRVGEAEYFDDMFAFRFQHFEGDNPSEIIYEQYTGLHDSKGREIYEGDIVHVTDGDDRDDVCDTGIGPVVFLESWGLWYVEGKLNNGLFDLHQENYIEVIGNIHESA